VGHYRCVHSLNVTTCFLGTSSSSEFEPELAGVIFGLLIPVADSESDTLAVVSQSGLLAATLTWASVAEV